MLLKEKNSIQGVWRRCKKPRIFLDNKNPTFIKDFRNVAGLSSGGASGSPNTADFMIKCRVHSNNIIKSRPALPLDGNQGGLPELIINSKNVNSVDFKVLKS